jgi:hypothetical protein
MNKLLLFLFLAATFCSCGGKVEKPQDNQPGNDTNQKENFADTTAHLPVAAFIRNEIAMVETYAGGLLKKLTRGNKRDSAYIQLDEFKKRAEQFLPKDLDSAFFQENFEQTSFVDETTEMINFIYTPKDSVGVLQKVVVYVQPGTSAHNVDRIYMETAFNQGDTFVEKKLTWKMRKYFYVLTIEQPKNGQPITTYEKLIWDPQHFGD